MAGTQVEQDEWGRTANGEAVWLFTLSNEDVTVKLCSFGARITSLRTKDRAGEFADIALGADELQVYLDDRKTYMGAVVGRFANRIAGGRFVLDGQRFVVPRNNGPNALHGGPEGFDRKLWTAELVENGVRLSYVSPDDEMGFPGNLSVNVTYTLVGNALRLEYEAACDRSTVVSLTNHAYFHLGGSASEIGEHLLMLPEKTYTPVDANLIPTGEIRSVDGSAMDFRTLTAMGARWDSEEEQIQLAGGYDQNWVLASGDGRPMLAAEVMETESGRRMMVFTTEPGVQFYSGNFLDGTFAGRSGACERRFGFCLETQRFPDTPNQPGFPSARVDAETPYGSTTIFVFN